MGEDGGLFLKQPVLMKKALGERGRLPVKKSTKIYALSIGALGLIVGILSCTQYFGGNTGSVDPVRFVILSLILFSCRCLPLYVRADCTIDMSFISVLAITLIEGPLATTVMCLITSPFVVVPSDDGKSYYHIFNTDPIKSIFNTANLVLTVAAAGVFFYLAGGEAGNIILPGVLGPMTVYILVAIVVNSLIMMILMALEMEMPFFPNIFGMFVQLLPSMACAAPVGFFLAYLMQLSSGAYIAALFMLPLVLARYSFKLFLDGKKQQMAMIQTLNDVIEAKDPYTQGHSARVSEYAANIAREMHLMPAQVETLRLAALFHDIGKIGIEDAILGKPARLTEEEWAVMKTHPRIGMNLLRNTHYYEQVKNMVLHHHETYDGKGYPDGIKGDEASLSDYILAIADAFDAMTSDRPYRLGMPMEKAREIIREEAGKQFHPEVAAAVVKMLEEGRMTVLYRRKDEETEMQAEPEKD